MASLAVGRGVGVGGCWRMYRGLYRGVLGV